MALLLLKDKDDKEDAAVIQAFESVVFPTAKLARRYELHYQKLAFYFNTSPSGAIPYWIYELVLAENERKVRFSALRMTWIFASIAPFGRTVVTAR